MSWMNEMGGLLAAITGLLSAAGGFMWGRRRKVAEAKSTNDIIIENDSIKEDLIKRIDQLSNKVVELHRQYLSIKLILQEKETEIEVLRKENEELKKEVHALESRLKTIENEK